MKKLTAIFAILVAANPLSAESIYKWVDKDGITHYSSKPVEGAKPADLPQIMRGERKLPAEQLLTCRDHTGIDCEAGPDGDGSVICSDGFRDSAQRFSFSCSAPKLQVTQVSPMQQDGAFAVIVRNSKSVAAQNAEVTVRFPDGEDRKLTGPGEIKGFDVAEFRYVPTPEDQLKMQEDPSLAAFAFKPGLEHVNITCGNCP